MKRLLSNLRLWRHRGRVIAETPGSLIRINGPCHIRARLLVGNNVHFNGISTYGLGNIRIGSNFHSAKGLVILTTSHNYNGSSIPYDKTHITKDVTIEDNVWCGMNVMILPGVRIGEGAIVQAGAVVSSAVSPLAIVGGNPARKIKFRDANHYNEMKRNGRFF